MNSVFWSNLDQVPSWKEVAIGISLISGWILWIHSPVEDDSHSPSFQWGLFELENFVPWNFWAKSGKSSANLWEANQGLFLGILGSYPLPMVDFPWDFRYECLFAEGQCLSNVFTCQILTGWWFIWGLYGVAERISTPWKFRLSNSQFATQFIRLFWSPNSCLAGCLPGIAGEPVVSLYKYTW